MSVQYRIQKVEADPKKEIPEHFSVYADSGLTQASRFWRGSEFSKEDEHAPYHVHDFPSQESADKFIENLQGNTAKQEDLNAHRAVEILGVKYGYDPEKDWYSANQGGHNQAVSMPIVHQWEIDRYLKTGELTPELASNAVEHHENIEKLSTFEKESLLNFAQQAKNDQGFDAYHEIEDRFGRLCGHNPPSRSFGLNDMPKNLKTLVSAQSLSNPVLFKKDSELTKDEAFDRTVSHYSDEVRDKLYEVKEKYGLDHKNTKDALFQADHIRGNSREHDAFLKYCDRRLHPENDSEKSPEVEKIQSSLNAMGEAYGNVSSASKMDAFIAEKRKEEIKGVSKAIEKHQADPSVFKKLGNLMSKVLDNEGVKLMEMGGLAISELGKHVSNVVDSVKTLGQDISKSVSDFVERSQPKEKTEEKNNSSNMRPE